MKDLEGWNGRTFKLEGNGFFTRENADMAEIRKAYQAKQSTPKGSYYVFVLKSADAGTEDGDTKTHGVQGDMPRGQQFGYVFSDQISDMSWLLAHELGHGVFTLKHLNDANYAGKSSLGSLQNLMDYTRSTALAAFQWNVMAHPAILTGLDGDDASKVVVKRLGKPILFALSKRKLSKDDNGNTKEDLCQNFLTEGQRKLFEEQLAQSSDQLFEQLKDLAQYFSIGDGEDNVGLLVRYFRNNKRLKNDVPNIYQNDYMDSQLNKNKLVDDFFTQGTQPVVEVFYDHLRRNYNIDINSLPLVDKIRSSRPIFNGFVNQFVSGMTFAVHDISSFEVYIIGFELKPNNTYDVEFKLVVYDHFGLDYSDIINLDPKAKALFYSKFKAWYVLQHDRGYMPFITKMECTRKYVNQKFKITK